MHVIGNYAFQNVTPNWLLPNIGLGVSLMHIDDQINATTTYTYPPFPGPATVVQTQNYQDSKLAISPLLRVGVTLFPNSWIHLRADLAWVTYGNTPSAAGETFDLGFSGVMIREAVEARF